MQERRNKRGKTLTTAARYVSSGCLCFYSIRIETSCKSMRERKEFIFSFNYCQTFQLDSVNFVHASRCISRWNNRLPTWNNEWEYEKCEGENKLQHRHSKLLFFWHGNCFHITRVHVRMYSYGNLCDLRWSGIFLQHTEKWELLLWISETDEIWHSGQTV